jgi:hypothetical protein
MCYQVVLPEYRRVRCWWPNWPRQNIGVLHANRPDGRAALGQRIEGAMAMAAVVVVAAWAITDQTLRVVPDAELQQLVELIETEQRRRSETRRELIAEHMTAFAKFRRSLFGMVKGGRPDAA